MTQYTDTFKSVWENPKARTILDDLMKKEFFESRIGYDFDALVSLVQKNVIAMHGNHYTWNKPLVRVAYQRF